MPTGNLEQAMTPSGISNLQSFGGIVLTATLFGRNLLHLHRPAPEDRDDDLDGIFWTRHRNIEGILLQTSLGLPDHLRLPSGLSDPNAVFLNMSIHTSVICLHQAAIFKADKYRLPANVSNESKVRCVTAAAEIASLMRMISHLDLATVCFATKICMLKLTRTDEPVHIILRLRRRSRFRTVSQNPPKRPTDEFFPPVPPSSHASPPPQKPPHRIFPRPARSRPRKRRHPRFTGITKPPAPIHRRSKLPSPLPQIRRDLGSRS